MTTDPAVLTWMIALAPRPRPAPVGRHWWRDLVTQTWRCAHDQWQADAEAASVGYATELAEYREQCPPPSLKQIMTGLSTGGIAP